MSVCPLRLAVARDACPRSLSSISSTLPTPCAASSILHNPRSSTSTRRCHSSPVPQLYRHLHSTPHGATPHHFASPSRRRPSPSRVRRHARRAAERARLEEEAKAVFMAIEDAEKLDEDTRKPPPPLPDSLERKPSATKVKDYLAERDLLARSGTSTEAKPATSPESPIPTPTRVLDAASGVRWVDSADASVRSALQRIFDAARDRIGGVSSTDAAATAADAETSSSVPGEDQLEAHLDGLAAPFNPSQLSKTERLETQARIITQAIRKARERGIIDDDESFFYPYPEGTPPSDMLGAGHIWLSLGSEPERWGMDIPPVKDRWLETLSLGLTKSIVVGKEGQGVGEEEDEFTSSLVDDYDLEDHERLEQLGDSIVNMSARLLAYQTYPDVNEGTLTRLSNYPTQNNILGILFRESGLSQRRAALREELGRQTVGNDPSDAGVDADATAEVDSDRRSDAPSSRWDDAASSDSSITRGLVKKDADMFEAYVAAVFLSHGCDFQVVHRWLTELFQPFQEQAYRFMAQRSEALSRMRQNQVEWQRSQQAVVAVGGGSDSCNGVSGAWMDPILTTFGTTGSSTAANASAGWRKVAGGLGSIKSPGEAFITDEFLTVAARARRQREERQAEQDRRRDQLELMNMGWFRKGFLDLRGGFQRLVRGGFGGGAEEERERARVEREYSVATQRRAKREARGKV
ncbi:hypothetical protein ACQY0O_000519 [Thecaphora frezii]